MSWGETLYLKNIFEKHRGLGASDITLKVLITDSISVARDEEEIASFVPNANGTLRIALEIYGSSSSSFYLSIKENGNQVFNTTFQNQENSKWENVYVDIPITKKSEYIISLYTSASVVNAVRARNLKLCGSITDPSLIE